MKTIIFALAALLFATSADAQQWVNGYTKGNGTYVQGYYRSTPDGNPYNNYSTRGNVNPFTGAVGTRNPTPSYGGNLYPQPTYQPMLTPLQNGQWCTGILC